MDEEDLRPKAPPGVARELKTLSIAELEAYVDELRQEIAQVESEIVKRRDVRGAADALFKPRPSGPAG